MAFQDDILTDDFSMDDLPNDILKGIYRYWLTIKQDRLMPNRADLNPSDISSLLPYLNLVDVKHDTQRYKMRLVGTETVKALGKDITGKYLDELPEMECYLKERYQWIVRERRPYVVSGKLRWSQKSYMNFCSIGLPLSLTARNTDILNTDILNTDIIMYGSYFELPVEKRAEFPTGVQ